MSNNLPPQHQKKQPGRSDQMFPTPVYDRKNYLGSSKLKDKVAIVTGGDSGIGRSVSYLFVKEKAKVTIVYLSEDKDAQVTKNYIEKLGGECLLLKGDLTDKEFSKQVVTKTIDKFGKLNVLVNNIAHQVVTTDFEEISREQLLKTFETNFFSYFYLSQKACQHLREGDTIINTTSVTAYRGSHHLIDYSATKGAIVSFTRSLSKLLAKKKIRVNGVAPGPIWTPLIPASYPAEQIPDFGQDVPLERVGQPIDVAPSYVFLASQDSSYMTGQILHPNGGEMVSS